MPPGRILLCGIHSCEAFYAAKEDLPSSKLTVQKLVEGGIIEVIGTALYNALAAVAARKIRRSLAAWTMSKPYAGWCGNRELTTPGDRPPGGRPREGVSAANQSPPLSGGGKSAEARPCGGGHKVLQCLGLDEAAYVVETDIRV